QRRRATGVDTGWTLSDRAFCRYEQKGRHGPRPQRQGYGRADGVVAVGSEGRGAARHDRRLGYRDRAVAAAVKSVSASHGTDFVFFSSPLTPMPTTVPSSPTI